MNPRIFGLMIIPLPLGVRESDGQPGARADWTEKGSAKIRGAIIATDAPLGYAAPGAVAELASCSTPARKCLHLPVMPGSDALPPRLPGEPMLNRIKDFFSAELNHKDDEPLSANQCQLASAALLIEVASA